MAAGRCTGCGGFIELAAYEVPLGVIAIGDRLVHEGCVIDPRAARRSRWINPVYLIPRSW